jgi:hypothetical protein
MAHQVKFSVPERKLGRSDVEFKVWQDDSLLGTLKVSRGSIVWFPSNTTYGYKTSWEKFDEVMKKHVTGEEVR